MIQDSGKFEHVGAFIRQKVIPRGMSVTDAAARLGVGRPALSNLLNGRSALSREMASRLEKAFGANRQELLEFQTKMDGGDQQLEDKSLAVRLYVPHFLTIKARQIDEWAARDIETRHQLPVLLRKLVHSTGHHLTLVDFPGYDNAERKGPDGVVEAGVATPWIPEGKSIWEFGTNQDPASKAEGDYAARLASVPAQDRINITFVFVTPRNWQGKNAWASKKNAEADWKAVRTLDASDIEQWLEESVPAQIWLAEKLDLPINGFETLDQSWRRWMLGSDPPMAPEIFESSIAANRVAFKAWLEQRSDRPLIVTADSKDEALAFLFCLFKDSEIASNLRDLPVVFDSVQVMRTLSSSSSPFIPIVHTDEVERELATFYRRLHCIALHPRNAVSGRANISLDLLKHSSFEKALSAMGFSGDIIERLARESGRSPTILRRRLSKIDSIRAPNWAKVSEVARDIVPVALVGAWNSQSASDREIVSTLANCSYQKIEESFTRLLQFDDPPVWSVDHYRGVSSKIDAFFAVNNSITQKDLGDFFVLAEYVLSESDPKLDLTEDKRWAAGIYGKLRDHSAALRDSICESLVILSIHGNDLFSSRLGIDVKALVSRLVERLLTPLTLDRLLSHDKDLPSYAEAAPDVVLSILEADLKQPKPEMLGLFEPADRGLFGSCPRSSLLWALECLAWKSERLSRVSVVLAQLSRTKIDDNWMNKPIASLKAIYRSWMPQTAASLKERIKVFEMLTKRFPDVAWQICIEQFDPHPQSGFYSFRPRWVDDAAGAGEPVSDIETFEFARKALNLALEWKQHNETTLGDLVERLNGMPEEDRDRVWDLIEIWSDTDDSSEPAKANLRERIRRFAFSRRATRRRHLSQAIRDRARESYAKLQPQDPVTRHAWLFANYWIDESSDELEDENFDYSKHGEGIYKLRTAAVKEIWEAKGFDGITALLSYSNAPHVIGEHVTKCIGGIKASINFLRRCLNVTNDLNRKMDGFLQGFLLTLDVEACETVVASVANGAGDDQVVRLFHCAPLRNQIWRQLDHFADEIRNRYWQEVSPYWNRPLDDAELTEVVEQLLKARRPRAAFHAAHLEWHRIETQLLKRVLRAVGSSDAELAGNHQINSYDLSKALTSLSGRASVAEEEMAQLEFMFIHALGRSEYGIPNLERQLIEAPILFVQILALLYHRNDGGEDPPEWQIRDATRGSVAALTARNVLDRIKRIPGTEANGKINPEILTTWLSDTRRLCAQYGRAEIGDLHIGQLLSKSHTDENGIWPCAPVCEAMENIASQQIARGFSTGIFNARGAHWHGEGGGQERELASKYRRWAQLLTYDYPHVGSVIENIATWYDRAAEREDSEMRIVRRLRH